MSFEGYYQVLCEKGHLHHRDCYGWSDVSAQAWVCDSLVDGKPCGASIGWDNLVDDTNCDAYGKVEMVEMTARITKTCDLGHVHTWTESTFAPMTKGPLGLLAEQAE
jgi:hypothetical protein